MLVQLAEGSLTKHGRFKKKKEKFFKDQQKKMCVCLCVYLRFVAEDQLLPLCRSTDNLAQVREREREGERQREGGG